MIRLVFLWLLVYSAACATRSAPVAVPARITLAIKGVGVLPMDREEVLRDQTVLVAGDRIVAITTGDVPIPRTAQVVDGRDQYLILGLWDMHVHTLGNAEAMFPTFLAHGVTGVRDMGSFLDSLDAVRQRMKAGLLLGPRLVSPGPLLDGPRQRWSHAQAWHIETPDQARAAVDSLSRIGVDFLKIYSTVSRETYLALANAARQRGLAFAGHIPFSVSADEASSLGQVSLEHAGLTVTTLPCITDGGARFRSLLGVWTSSGYDAYLVGSERLRRERKPGCVERLYERYRTNGTWVTPTIVNTIKDSASVNWPALSHLSDQARNSCQRTVEMFHQASADVRHRSHTDFLEDVGALHRSGVRLMAGTDVPNPCVVPGASLHDELDWLVRAGLTPYESLQTATSQPATFLRLADSLGVIRPGWIADLVLLAANPLRDIRATREITGIVLGGRYFDSAELARRLEARGR